MTITGKNAGGNEISVRWNRYLGTLVVDMVRNGETLVCGRALRMGDQEIAYGVRAYVSNGGKVRYFGDVQDADIEFYTGCSRG